jgi:excinuclease UvrABC nuclease subunit
MIVNADNLEEVLTWSEWLDFDKSTIETVPESPGLYKMHASMKILYIGSSTQNIKKSLIDCLSDPCVSKAKRFSYALTESSDKVKGQLLNEYRSKHNNKLPECMQEDE